MTPDRDNQVYYDTEKGKFYIIQWIETGNNDIPKRHYIPSPVASNSKDMDDPKNW